MIRQSMVDAGIGEYCMRAGLSVSDGGISVYLCGGTVPHIGTVVLAEPRRSLTGFGWSCTSSVLNLCGHKDEVFARELAEELCQGFQMPVCVCAGIHIDKASEVQIKRLTESFMAIKTKVLKQVELMTIEGPQ